MSGTKENLPASEDAESPTRAGGEAPRASDAGGWTDALGDAARRAADRLVGGEAGRAGTQLGPFTLLSLLGEGGFGEVWLAERRHPMVQRVALKVIKPGMDSRAVIARFEQERQALAVMDHPNVARVLDGGVAPDGRPYFVMELVKGEPLNSFCDRLRMTVRERLELFVTVCEAVQHAHMKGVIHRDLKPSNILVEEVDGRPLAKVIDFGVAKAISHSMTDKTIHTQRGEIIGTPEYMSPEQAEVGATDVDTRSDVYSLGVVLYELLSGTLPFDPRTLRAGGYAGIQRVIREVEPPRPSTRISGGGADQGALIAARRRSDPARLSGELKRELEWIPLKAIRKERSRRYPSAESLAADVRRYLEGKPLEAAPESRSYLLRKMIARNRGRVAAAGALSAALMVGLVSTLWQAREAVRQAERADERAAAALSAESEQRRAAEAERAAREEAQASRASAERQRAIAEDVVEFLNKDLLLQASPRENPDAGLKFITVVERAAGRLEGRFPDRPEVEARVRLAIGRVFSEWQRAADAEPMLERALELALATEGEESLLTAEVLHAQAWTRGMTDDPASARRGAELCRRAGDLYAKLAGADDPRGLICRGDQAMFEALVAGRSAALFDPVALRMVASVRGRGESAEDVERLFRAMLAEIERLVEAGDRAGALAMIEAEAAPFLANPILKGRVPLSLAGLCAQLSKAGYKHSALCFGEKAVEVAARVLPKNHPDAVVATHNRAWALMQAGRAREAAESLRGAMPGLERAFGPRHDLTLRCRAILAQALVKDGRPQEALELLEPMEKVFRATYGTKERSMLVSLLVTCAEARVGLGFERGRFERAERELNEALMLFGVEHAGRKVEPVDVARVLAVLHEAWEQAEPGNGHGDSAAGWRAKSVRPGSEKPR